MGKWFPGGRNRPTGLSLIVDDDDDGGGGILRSTIGKVLNQIIEYHTFNNIYLQ